jgi:ABC-type uncharacterized transport system substrate-binding protein
MSAAVLSLTRQIPIVFVNPADPVRSGFVASLAQPGGNATGTTGLSIELISKRLEVLHEIAPRARRVGFVSMPEGLSPALDKTNQLKFAAGAATATALGMTIARRPLPKSMDADALSALIAAGGDEALYVVFDPLKADPALSHIPVIAVTSYALWGAEEKTRAAGCDGYVAKPFSPRQLLTKVRELVG